MEEDEDYIAKVKELTEAVWEGKCDKSLRRGFLKSLLLTYLLVCVTIKYVYVITSLQKKSPVSYDTPVVIKQTQPDPPGDGDDTLDEPPVNNNEEKIDTPDNKKAKKKEILEVGNSQEEDIASSGSDSSDSKEAPSGTSTSKGSENSEPTGKRAKSASNKKGAGRKKKVYDPSAEMDLAVMETIAPKVLPYFSVVEPDASVTVLLQPNLVFFNQPDLHISTASLSELFSNGAVGCMIVGDQELFAGLEAILTPTVMIKKHERSMFTLDRTVTLHVPNKTQKLNRGGMCCSALHLLVFTLTANKTEVKFYPFPDSEEEWPADPNPPPKKTDSIIPQVWKVAPLSKPERKPFKDVKIGRQIPISTYTTILTHLYQQVTEGGTILNKAIVQIGISHGSLLTACIKVF